MKYKIFIHLFIHGMFTHAGTLRAKQNRLKESIGYLQRVLNIDGTNKHALNLYNKLTNSSP